MEYIKLIGILIVILGFAFKLDSILIIFISAIVTAFVGGLGVDGFLETFGTTFVSNRSMAIFIMILLVTGTLERNGLREGAASLIQKVKGVTAGKLVCAYGVMRAFFAAFNVGFGGVAGFVRPVVLPMAEGAIEAEGEVCMYLQKDGKYIAALSFFLNTQTLSENEWEILKSTGKCISEMYLVAQKKVITKQKFFHEFFDGINIGAAILNQKMEIIDMNKTFSDFCKIIVRHGSIDTESVMSNLKGKQNEKNYAQSVINHLGANIIMRPEKIKID